MLISSWLKFSHIFFIKKRSHCLWKMIILDKTIWKPISISLNVYINISMCVFLLFLLILFTSTHQSSQHFCLVYILLQPLSNNNCLAFVFQQPWMNQSLRRAAPLFLSLSLSVSFLSLSLLGPFVISPLI